MMNLSPISRRSFVSQSTMGGLALASMLSREPLQAGVGLPAGLHHPPRAKRVIQLFMAGAASHIDMFDHKPELIKRHGEESDFGEHVEAFQNGLGPWMKSPFAFKRYGRCGKLLSEIVEPLGEVVDDISFVHNMVGKTGVHSQATYLQSTGFQLPGFPGAGSWVSYALGSENEDLPAFVVLPDHRGFASNGPKNWGSAFLPTHTQGTTIFPQRSNPIEDLHPQANFVTKESHGEGINLINQLNRMHQQKRPLDPRLDSRIRSYELGGPITIISHRCPRSFQEPNHILKMYGLENPKKEYPKEINPEEETEYFGRKCLIARRLIERGVRFVQVWSGNDNGFPRRNWDSHEDMTRDHPSLSLGMARGTAGLIKDLKQRGLLEDTIIHWTTEFGRMPSSQGSKGRDHNPFVFTNWFAGGGFQGGMTHGESDQWGYKPLDRKNPTTVYDTYATMLHQLGFDHERLTVRHNSIDRRLTDVHGHVVTDILA